MWYLIDKKTGKVKNVDIGIPEIDDNKIYVNERLVYKTNQKDFSNFEIVTKDRKELPANVTEFIKTQKAKRDSIVLARSLINNKEAK